MSSYGDLREKKESWKFLIWDPWQHNFVIFNIKLGWLTMSFLEQVWSLGIQESKASNGSQFELEMREL